MVLVLVIDRGFSITIEHDYEQEHEHEKAKENIDWGSWALEIAQLQKAIPEFFQCARIG
jgi:hypothetical protein